LCISKVKDLNFESAPCLKDSLPKITPHPSETVIITPVAAEYDPALQRTHCEMLMAPAHETKV
jgi:hypothetical protein